VLRSGADTSVATRPLRRSTYTSPRTLVAPRPRPAPLTRSARHKLLAALLAVVIAALVVILAASAGGRSSAQTKPAHHHRAAARPVPRGATPADSAHALAAWLRGHAG
jgi:hypothetical protein